MDNSPDIRLGLHQRHRKGLALWAEPQSALQTKVCGSGMRAMARRSLALAGVLSIVDNYEHPLLVIRVSRDRHGVSALGSRA
jgi:hypothetical protein